MLPNIRFESEAYSAAAPNAPLKQALSNKIKQEENNENIIYLH